MGHKKRIFKISKGNENQINKYLEYKKVSVSDKGTLDRYGFFLKVFIEKLKKEIQEINEEDLIKAVNNINKEYKIGSVNDIKILIKSFLFWKFEEKTKYVFRNIDKICAGLRKEKSYHASQMLSIEDVEKLVKEEGETRWKAFFLLYFYGGFRPSEVCNLKWKDIIFDKEGAFVKIYVKKNGKTFEKYIPENVCYYLKKIQNNNSQYVFPTKRTNKHGVPVGDVPMTHSGVYQHLIPLAKKVLNKHVNPYILRHSIATILYNKDNLKDDDVAKQMGHSIKMKETYNNLSIDKIRERMKKIYIETEDLPPEKRAELEKLIENMQKQIKQLQENYDELSGAVAVREMKEDGKFGTIFDNDMMPPIKEKIDRKMLNKKWSKK